MKISKILTVAVPLALGGCDFFNDDSDSFQPSQPAQPPAHGDQASAPEASSSARSGHKKHRKHAGRKSGKSSSTAYQPQDPQQLVTPHPAPARPSEYTPQSSTPFTSQGRQTSGGAPSSPPLPPTLPAPHPPSPDPDWHPNEGHIVKAGELVMELKGNNGGAVPKYGAMASYIQTKMNLSPDQAQKVLEELGIEKS